METSTITLQGMLTANITLEGELQAGTEPYEVATEEDIFNVFTREVKNEKTN